MILSNASFASQCPGRESNQLLTAYTCKMETDESIYIVIMQSFPLRPEYMSLYQWSWILRVSFSSSQSTCMQCVLHKHEKCIKSHFHVVYKLMDIDVKSHANVSYVIFVSALSKMAISRSCRGILSFYWENKSYSLKNKFLRKSSIFNCQ